ncbi:uncharacterized protein LOC108027070 [Drosophila biarmipes]|uniref:uncharacterized protein LOC108027070 n=1 Tax=Drosophila biarmipes TaxID=125945 RepID=UPI0007E7E7EC|nr:uncharacterized protein LOC108027070 [Drosophila biarmipes]XP_016953772.1 uncharacterized protein LOC108027070 [Drosophila biarmipes]
MDLSKAESQRPAEERRSGNPDYVRSLLQDILCFLVLLSVALLIVAGILFVVEDVSRLQQQQQHQHQHHRHLHRDQVANDWKGAPVEEAPKQGCRFFRPHTWIRFFNCQKKIPQHQEEVEKEAVRFGPSKQDDRDQQPFEPVPTYLPAVEPLPLRAAGDYIEDAANKKLDSEPHQLLADNVYRT